MTSKKLLLLALLLWQSYCLWAQRNLNLNEAISIAQAQSIEAKLAENIRENR